MPDFPGAPWTFLGIFVTGLGLNLTPCVYPMISVTTALFGTKKHLPRAVLFAHALTYVAGICAMYTALGVAAALTGGFFGAALQNRYVLIAISALLALLAFGMFGFYNFQAPNWLLQKISKNRGASYLSLFLSGLFVGIFAAPCIGPPIIALLTFVGTRQDPVFAFQAFFILSLGLGSPYLILGTFSGLLHRLPKSGVWLIWVERLFGMILFAAAFFYLLLAVNPPLTKWLVPLAITLGGIYLGFIERAAHYTPRFILIKRTLGALAALAGIWLIILTPREGVRWEAYSAEKLQIAREAGKPAVLDFYADWCIPCHELDQFTFTDKRVIAALENFARLKVDLTDPEGKEAAEVIDKFDVVGVPVIAFVDPKGEEIKSARITGFVSADEFMENLKRTQEEKQRRSAFVIPAHS